MKYARKFFRPKSLGAFIMATVVSLHSPVVQAEKKMKFAQLDFGTDFLRGGEIKVDMSRFNRPGTLLPGQYLVDVFINGAWAARRNVLFLSAADDDISACVNRAMLELADVDLSRLDPAAAATITATRDGCLALEDIVPDATVVFDSAELRLDLSIPQISLRRVMRGYVNPESWDHGVTAATASYNLNVYRTSSSGRDISSYYLSLNSGINLGEWRLRNYSNLTDQSGSRLRIQTISSYAQRSILPLESELTVGDFYTSGHLFDSISYRGVQLGSDPRMLPDSQIGYAPVIRGVARTNAKVGVWQRGNPIYETTVPPGRFEISDLNPTGFGGDLTVIVTEADGARSSFVVPYAAVPQLLRPDASRYSLVAGRTRSQGLNAESGFVQLTYERGISNTLTLLGGLLASPGYTGWLAGSAVSTPIGAMSLALIQSDARINERDKRIGQSIRLDYNKFLNTTDTNITLVAYRYSSKGYLRLQDFQALREFSRFGTARLLEDRQRSHLQLNVSQRLGERLGSLYVSGSAQNYWNRPGSTTQYQMGYNNSWGRMSYNISVARQKDLASGRVDTQYFFSLSFPLGLDSHAPTLSSSMTRSSTAGGMTQTYLTGTAGEDNAFSYGASASRGGEGVSSALNAQYRAPAATLGVSYSYGAGGLRQMSAQAAGAVVMHAGGMILSQGLGDTIGIVQARGAGGAVVSSAGVRVNRSGFAVVPYLTPYRTNEVALDPKGISTDVELKVTSQRVVPYAGAVVLMKYETANGRSLFIRANRPNGEPVPFGAEVKDGQGKSVGAVGQGGLIFVRLEQESDAHLSVQWGKRAQDRCSLAVALTPRTESQQQLVAEQIEGICETAMELTGRSRMPGMAESGKDDIGGKS